MNESLVHKFLCLIVNNHSHETFLWILKQAIDKCISELITVKSENSSNRVVLRMLQKKMQNSSPNQVDQINAMLSCN